MYARAFIFISYFFCISLSRVSCVAACIITVSVSACSCRFAYVKSNRINYDSLTTSKIDYCDSA